MIKIHPELIDMIPQIGHKAFALLVIIRHRAGYFTDVYHADMTQLQKELGVPRDSVYQAIKVLKNNGLITVEQLRERNSQYSQTVIRMKTDLIEKQ